MSDIPLSDFIGNTLVEIARGVKKANDQLVDTKNNIHQIYELRSTRGDHSKALGIKFDVALSITASQKDKAGFFVALANIGGSANTEKEKGQDQQHRIQFEVGINQGYQ
jgi:hypothetical protein